MQTEKKEIFRLFYLYTNYIANNRIDITKDRPEHILKTKDETKFH